MLGLQSCLRKHQLIHKGLRVMSTQSRPRQTVNAVMTQKISKFEKQHFNDFCDPISSMLGAKLAYDPKIKVVTLLKYYNFVLGWTSIQSF